MGNEHKTNAGKALRESERRLRALLDNLPGMVYTGRSDWRAEYVCNSEEICGYSAGQFERGEISWLEIVHPDDRDRVREEASEIGEGCTKLVQEYRIIDKDGGIRWVEDHGTAHFWDDGSFLCVDGIVFDVTKRKYAEDELRASEEKYRFLFNAIPTGIGISDYEGNILDCNRATEEMLGYSRDELKLMNVTDYYGDPDERPKLMDMLGESGKLRNVELGFRRKDGSILDTLINVDVIERDGKKVLLTTSRNVTERKRAEIALKESERKHRALIANIPAVTWTTDSAGNTTFISINVERVYGYSPEEIYAQGDRLWLGRVHPDDVGEVRNAFRALFEENKPYDIEYRIRRKDGEWIWLHDRSISTYEKDGTRYADGIFTDVTKRKKAEEEIRKFKTIAERAGYGSAIVDLEGNLVFVNRSFAEMHGYRIDELIGKKLSIFHSEEQRGRVNILNEQLVEEGSYVAEEVWHVKRDNTEFPALMNGTLIKDEAGKPLFMAATAIDITESKLAEEALRQSEQRYRSLVENLPQKVFLKDLNSIYVSCNENFACDLGISPEEAVGKSDYDFFPAQMAEKYRADDKRIVESGETKDIEEVYIAGGQEMVVHTVKTPVRDAEGSITGVLGIFWDVTEQHRLEQALRESEQKYRAVVESAGETIASLDRNGVYLFINGTGAERLGGKVEDFIGKTIWDVFPNEIAERQMGIVRAVIDSGKEVNSENATVLQGRTRWYNTTIEPLRDSRGEVTAALVIARDVHDVRQAELEREAYSEKMMRAEQLASLGTLSATLAHELTQPLTVISLSLEDALAELEIGPCLPLVGEALQDSLKEVSSVTSIVERFRNFARKSAEKSIDKVDIQAVAERIVKLLNRSARQAGVELCLVGIEGLPAIYANEKELEQLFFALIQNAIQAAGDKSDRELVVSGVEKDGFVELRFTDNCGGIEPEDVDRIFEPFFTTKGPGEGTGLGLCIVQRVAERSGGRAQVENRLGEGATFVVTLGIGENGMS